ncbi:MAG: PaaI family thioesterase [Clostridiales bacterium]|nr:PaaI family thioesterase [Clostridiales bacterium]
MKVTAKQTNSKSCIICGMDNDSGLKAQFYNLEDGSVGCLMQYGFYHQSFPERVHGGMISALLDELIGRALWVTEPNVYGVTTTLNVKFRKPVPYGTPLKARAVLNFNSPRGFSGVGYVYDMSGNLLAEGEAKYLKLDTTKISANADVHEEMAYLIEDSVTEIDFPETIK